MSHSQKSKLLIFIFLNKKLFISKKNNSGFKRLDHKPSWGPRTRFLRLTCRWTKTEVSFHLWHRLFCGLKYCTMQGFSTFWYCSKGYNASLYWRNAAASWHYNKSLTSTWVIIVTFFAHFYSGYHRFFSWARVAICFGVLGVVTCNHNGWFLRHSLLLKTESLDDAILELWLA